MLTKICFTLLFYSPSFYDKHTIDRVQMIYMPSNQNLLFFCLLSALDILVYQNINMEILARAVPEPLKKFAEMRQVADRLKIEGMAH